MLRQSGRVGVEELAIHFGVTLQTIRRDLNELSDAKALVRVHGGAMIASGVANLAYEARQYRALADAVAALCAAYPTLSPQRLVGHSEIAPGRKTDPGPAFDWPHARRLIAATSGGQATGHNTAARPT